MEQGRDYGSSMRCRKLDTIGVESLIEDWLLLVRGIMMRVYGGKGVQRNKSHCH